MDGRGWVWIAAGAAILLLGGRKVVDLKNASENERRFAPAIAAAEQAHGIPAGMLHRLIKRESHFRTDIITGAKKSPVGAVGIAQFMPATAKEEGVNPLEPLASITAAARYLAKLYRIAGTWQKAVASYNWGIGNVTRTAKARGADWLAYAPTETKNYVREILG